MGRIPARGHAAGRASGDDVAAGRLGPALPGHGRRLTGAFRPGGLGPSVPGRLRGVRSARLRPIPEFGGNHADSRAKIRWHLGQGAGAYAHRARTGPKGPGRGLQSGGGPVRHVRDYQQVACQGQGLFLRPGPGRTRCAGDHGRTGLGSPFFHAGQGRGTEGPVPTRVPDPHPYRLAVHPGPHPGHRCRGHQNHVQRL